ncbi:glyoxalase superfamily protein [Epibacterium sp. Ofav1-8]|uniref:glyoxalase superfamily protein n=1 Tax=Epibacterium sp. Ofav1-8 TaxID=2917735 RepID=UPI001EF6AD88|nr:glyoxalase superfamily protein [Epibacterium sp. Ofav1-8]MCG7624522.1 glyoxalase superfamily protein [Epibacterium sp. Ofav1-8]
MKPALPSLAEAKARARDWRRQQADAGTPVTHSAALEHVAHALGFRDWNACAAMLGRQRAQRLALGARVAGRYLSQPFTARIIRATPAAGRPGWVRLELDLDQPVDVVTSTRFSNLRRRISGVIGPDGHSRERTSDGQPHLVIDPLAPDGDS